MGGTGGRCHTPSGQEPVKCTAGGPETRCAQTSLGHLSAVCIQLALRPQAHVALATCPTHACHVRCDANFYIKKTFGRRTLQGESHSVGIALVALNGWANLKDSLESDGRCVGPETFIRRTFGVRKCLNVKKAAGAGVGRCPAIRDHWVAGLLFIFIIFSKRYYRYGTHTFLSTQYPGSTSIWIHSPGTHRPRRL